MNHSKTLSTPYHTTRAKHFSFRAFLKKIKTRFLDAILFSLVGRVKD